MKEFKEIETMSEERVNERPEEEQNVSGPT